MVNDTVTQLEENDMAFLINHYSNWDWNPSFGTVWRWTIVVRNHVRFKLRSTYDFNHLRDSNEDTIIVRFDNGTWLSYTSL